MASQACSLAVLLRAVQWELDEAAFEIGGGRYSEEQRATLADRLDQLATVLRTNGQLAIVDETSA
ncbi:hypothetical protein [Saccharopolyspora sp. NPDC002376]